MFPPLFVIVFSLCVFANEVTGEIEWVSLPGSKKLYGIGDTPMSWIDAWKYCYNIGSELLSITDPSEERMLTNYLFTKYGKERYFWSSGNIMPNKKEKIINKRIWFWMGSGQPMLEPKWCPGEPNNAYGKENCLLLYTNIACWNDALCHDTNHDGVDYVPLCNKGKECPCDGNEGTGTSANGVMTEVTVNGKQIPVNNQTVTYLPGSTVNLPNGAIMAVQIDVDFGDKNNA